ncbi:hypothetical protein SAMN05444266_109220 [Chitinophaga jiangningensis]|uniref:DUF6603 domain-containing protein n=1 Tax=Chitinophaga jiangningensis TaxID=1419482 RepID=A0A1M7KB66_9BACT|nr:DUF6603 domain-containing protein [Chitinophaga jiangningensis]SHM62087.1 hypothetical protein SAMN05444266_109220 [Chitinophaga jiangningensis]
MSQQALQSILTQAALAISPLRGLTTPEKAIAFFQKMGYNFPGGAFGNALGGAATQGRELVNAVQQLAAANTETAVLAAIANLFVKFGATVHAIQALQSQLQSGPGGGLPHIGDLSLRLTDYLLLDYLDNKMPQLHATMLVLGLIEHDPSPQPNQSQRVVHWDRLGLLFSHPQQLFDAAYQWNTAFDAEKFLSRLELLMRAAQLPGGLYPQADTTRTILGNTTPNLPELRFPLFQKGLTKATYSQFGLTFSPAEGVSGKKKGMAVLPYLMGGAAFDFDVCDRGQLLFESTADIKGVGIVVRPPFDVQGILNLVSAFHAAITIKEKPEKAAEMVLIGSAGGTRLAIQGLSAKWYLENPQGKLDVGVEGEIQAIRLVVKGGEGDGFLAKVLSALNIQAEANIALGFSLLHGFTIRGGAQLAIELAVHIDLGPLSINSLRLTLKPTGEQIGLDAGVVLKLALGPLTATVENIGLSAALQFKKGNLGPANLDVGFKPPNGVGLAIDAGVVKGGGYLFFDFDREEYAGALELTFSEIVSLKAIGIITTKMPDGSKGFSLLIIISAEFGTGLQLGFGFVLLGVGGLLGLNRTMKLQALADGVRTGGINGIMFPTNIVENAPRIISDLRNFFPPEEGKFLIGPMAKLGWGTPALISVSLGIIIEIPGNIAIIGVLKVALPVEDAALIVLQINFIGAIEFDKSRLWFFASLYDSRILWITLQGEMGLLVAWGDDANFVVSVGGFHPAFNPPPLPFPNPVRLSLNILDTSWGRIRVMAYFAVTSNTVQFGAHAELYFGFSAFHIEGELGFDALFQFSPFYFIIEVSLSLSVKVFGIGLFSVRVRMSLDGPTPYHVKGTGSISILFFDIDVDFEFSWGDSANTTLPPVEVMPLVKKEFDKLENWKAQLPEGNNLLVSLRTIDTNAELVLHPLGVLQVSQRFIPLELPLDKVGTQKPSDANRFTVTADPAAGLAPVNKMKAPFAMAQFQNMSNDQKLARPSFEKENSGLELSVAGPLLNTGRAVKRIVRYELITIDTNYKRFVKKYFRFISGTLFRHFLKGNAAALSTLSKKSKSQLQPFEDKIKTQQSGYAVANQSDNKAFHAATFESEAQARAYMQQQVALHPNLKEAIHVIPQHEINTAA